MTNALEQNSRPPRLLIADDDVGIVRFLATRCANMGFDVQTASNGLQALIMAGRRPPDVLIVDINMPELDGLAVSRKLLQPDREPLEIIVITARPDAESEVLAQNFCAHHVRKGINLWDGVRAALIEMFPELERRISDDKTVPANINWELPRVLLVDSDPDLGLLLSSRLRKCGVETLLAHDPAQGLKMASRDCPSVIILDFQMAHYLLSRLRVRAETKKTPIFVTCASRLAEDAEWMLRQEVCGQPGAIRILQKSEGAEPILTALQKFCAFRTTADFPRAPLVSRLPQADAIDVAVGDGADGLIGISDET